MGQSDLVKRFRVAEIFGPTIQGEGRLAGIPCHFIRFGGCDYRCSWCDTPHAVLPDQVAQLPKMSSNEIALKVLDLPVGPDWIVISGGNPLVLDLSEVVDDLHEVGFELMVETQGTIYKPWLDEIQDVCISPKPPSSGNETQWQIIDRFLQLYDGERDPYLKIVVFDDADYLYARHIRQMSGLQMFLSVGNSDPSLPTVGNPYPPPPPPSGILPLETVRNIVCNSYRDLAEKVANDRVMSDVRVMAQMHVLAWGNQRGH